METNVTPAAPLVPPTPPGGPFNWRSRLLAFLIWLNTYRWRFVLAAAVFSLAGIAWVGEPLFGLRGRAALGVVCFIGAVAVFSSDLRALNWRTISMGVLMQVLLALFILRFSIPGPVHVAIGDTILIDVPEGASYRPGYLLFDNLGKAVEKFLEFTDAGTKFVFGDLADDNKHGFIFAIKALPAIIFVSAFFTVLYHLGVLQFFVRISAKIMMWLMHTSGAETLAAVAEVFMGQTEAPLIVKPYIPRMTQSELLSLMVGGMGTIAGGVMAVYIKMGADQVAILATSVMSAPCCLYLTKIMLPETETPQTTGNVITAEHHEHRNVIDAAAAGASDGMRLALNVAAMLIAFLAFIACINYCLGLIRPDWSLEAFFSWLFYPVAMLMGVEDDKIPNVAELLGTKLVANEFVAYINLTAPNSEIERGSRAFILSTYALTGFANFASIGIQLGGIGGMAPERRADLARLGLRALYVGFLATLVNAAVAGLLL